MAVYHRPTDKEHGDRKKREVAAGSAAAIVFVALAETGGTFDNITIGEHSSLFEDWVFPKEYKVGQVRFYKGKLYRCLKDHKSQSDWMPDAATSLWVAISDPAEEWPAWSQPIGAHDAYGKGDKVSHKDKHWTSTAAGNVWEPGAYGWEEVK